MNLINPNDRFAIFGARGMAGSAISRALDRAGYQKQLKPSRDQLDLLDPAAVNQWFSEYQPDVVVLAAAKVGGIHANNTYPADFLLENLKIQTHVIETSWRSGVKRLLFLGSSCIYPKYAKSPIVEEELLKGPLESTNEWYAIAKITGIKMCEALRKQYAFDAISLMPTNLYGPGDNYQLLNSHVFPALIRRFYEAREKNLDSVLCWGTGKPMREFLHVDDLAKACIMSLEKWSPIDKQPNFLNVGTGKDISIRELAGLIAKHTRYSGEIQWDDTKPDGTLKKQLDISKIEKLGWSAEITLEEGIIRTIAEFDRMNKNHDEK